MKMSSLNCSVKMSPHGDMGDTHDEQEGSPARGADQGCTGRPHQQCPGGDDGPERPSVSASESPVPGGGGPGPGAQSPGAALGAPLAPDVQVRIGELLQTTYAGFALWLLRAFFQSIPVELEEAARVDGAGRPRAVLYVVAPLALPGLIATAIFTFTLAWNDYIFTRILIASDELKTLPVGVQDLFAAAVVDWGLVMAAGMLITLPALAFFMAVQRHLVAGWGSGGLKG